MAKIKITEEQLSKLYEILKITDTDANTGSFRTNASKTAQSLNNSGLGTATNSDKFAVSVNDKHGELGFGPDKDVTISNSNNKTVNEKIMTVGEILEARKKYIKEHSETITIKDFLKRVK